MKLSHLSAFTAMLAGTAFVGCSSDQAGTPVGEGTSDVNFNLTTSQGVVITSVNYDLNTSPAGADVADGAIPVPNPDSVIELGIESLPPGTYSLAFSATGTYQGETVPCVSTPVVFPLAAGQDLTLPTISMTCTIEVTGEDNTGSVNANVGVVVEQITVPGNTVEVFTYGPRTVTGRTTDGACVYPPVALKVFNNDATITYGWAATPNGTLALNATNTQGTYTCTSSGAKTLTVTATQGGASTSKSVIVQCNDECGITGPTCGDGVVEGTEQCDGGPTPPARCPACVIVPTCGDGIVDAPEGCDTAGPSATCTVDCQPIIDLCGNGTVDPGEECDTSGASATCTADCELIELCGNGTVDPGEECDTGGASATCTADCQDIDIVDPNAACYDCIEANPDLGPVQASYCDPDALCLDVQECVLNSGCYLPVPAFCFCGDNVDGCESPTYTPNGPCRDLIRQGTNTSTDAENALTLEQFYNFDLSAGKALLIIDEASRACTSSCNL
jgi:hypothetical protein